MCPPPERVYFDTLCNSLCASSMASAAKSIMIADDSEDDVTLLEHVLHKAGVVNRVIITGNGEETIDYLKGVGRFADRQDHPLPDILLLDLKLPRLSGYEVLEWCQTQPQVKNLVIVVLTGSTDLKMAKRAYELGARSFLLKPCTPQQIAELIRAFPGSWSIQASA